MFLAGMVAAALTPLLALAALRFVRERRLARIRATWGEPIDRTRRTDAMAASHRGRLACTSPSRALDDRTWADLDLDAVFAAIDRTQSTLGQHALYHRLRTSPVGDHLAAFEALVTRMGREAPVRERAQLALDRLQDPQGYDIWWLAAPGGSRAALVVGADGLVFDHRLQRGPSTSRNAITLLRLHGAPDAMIRRAMTTAAMLDEQRRVMGIGE